MTKLLLPEQSTLVSSFLVNYNDTGVVNGEITKVQDTSVELTVHGEITMVLAVHPESDCRVGDQATVEVKKNEDGLIVTTLLLSDRGKEPVAVPKKTEKPALKRAGAMPGVSLADQLG